MLLLPSNIKIICCVLQTWKCWILYFTVYYSFKNKLNHSDKMWLLKICFHFREVNIEQFLVLIALDYFGYNMFPAIIFLTLSVFFPCVNVLPVRKACLYSTNVQDFLLIVEWNKLLLLFKKKKKSVPRSREKIKGNSWYV